MILIVDDDRAIRASLEFMLRRAGYEARVVAGPKEALEAVRAEQPQLVLMDMNFSLSTTGQEGLTLLREVKIFAPATPVILMTAWGSIELAVEGMRAGASDFVTKPWNNAALMSRITTALQLSAPKEGTVAGTFDRSAIVGDSPALNEVLQVVKRVARTNASVLITGESGTGKELVAQCIHQNSLRAAQPFVKVNLGGVPQALFESEMFGHKKGAFTDAVADRKGRFELADRGTIFLDEIGELDMACQVKLLRVLQEQTFEPLGESRPRRVDIRVVSATNANLPQLVADRAFREDLYYRINLITIHLPALRERKGDIAPLAEHFAARQCRDNGLEEVVLTDSAKDYLRSLPFPGNIRELKNLVERTIIVSGGRVLDASHFEAQHRLSAQETASPMPAHGLTLDEMERRTIISAMERHGGNVSRVAAALGVSRQALYRRLEKLGIQIGQP